MTRRDEAISAVMGALGAAYPTTRCELAKDLQATDAVQAQCRSCDWVSVLHLEYVHAKEDARAHSVGAGVGPDHHSFDFVGPDQAKATH